jgi:hypothetical protein
MRAGQPRDQYVSHNKRACRWLRNSGGTSGEGSHAQVTAEAAPVATHSTLFWMELALQSTQARMSSTQAMSIFAIGLPLQIGKSRSAICL